MLISEIRKIFNGKFILILLSLCLLNVFLIYYGEIRETPYHGEGGYKEQWERLERDLPASELDTTYERASQEYQENILSGYSKALVVQKRILDELQGLLGYSDYLGDMRASAERIQSISILRESESRYTALNRERTIAAYEKMESLELQPGPSLGVELFATSQITDVLSLLLIIYAVFLIWIKDREEGMQNLLFSCYRGRKHLAAVKALAGVFVSIVIVLLMYGGTFFIGQELYGMGDLSRALPSVYLFQQTAWPVPVWEFLLLFLLLKLAAYSLCMFLFGSIAGRVQSATGTILVSGLIMGFSYGIYRLVSGDSYGGILKYLLPYGLLRTENLFLFYRNLNLFGYPAELTGTVCTVLFLGIAVFLLVLIREGNRGENCAGRHKMFRFTGKRLRVPGAGRWDGHCGLWGNELRKILIDRKVLLILLVLVFLQGYLYKNESVKYYNYTEYCYRQYMEYFAGELTPQKIAELEGEKNRFEELLDSQNQLLSENDTDIERQLQAYDAFCMVWEYYEYLCDNDLHYMVYEPAYQELSASAGNGKDAFLAFEMMAFMVLCAVQIYGPEDQLRMNRLYSVAAYGRRLELVRMGIAAGIGCIILCLSYLPFLRSVIEAYKISGGEFFYPAGCLRNLSIYGNRLSIGGYLLVISVFRFLFLNFGSFAVCFLSRRLKSVMNTVMLGILLLALPFGVLMLVDSAAPFFILYSPLLGNYLMTLPLILRIGIPVLILLCICAIAHKKDPRGKKIFTF